MKKIGILIAAVLAVAIGLGAAPVFAEALTKTSDALTSVAKDQTVDGSAYLAGETITVDGTVKGDVYCAGKTVVISGTIEGDVLCAAQSLTLNGVVRGDVRLAASDIRIKGTIDGSASLAAVTLTTDSASKIGRDMTVWGTRVTMSGVVSRDVMLGANEVVFEGTVGRDMKADFVTLQAASSARVGGSLSYMSANKATIPDGSVAGTVSYTESKNSFSGQVQIGWGAFLAAALMVVLSFVFLAALIALVAPRYIEQVSDGVTSMKLGMSFLVGLAAYIVAPALILLLMVSIIGAYAGIVVGLTLILMVMVGSVLVAHRLGCFMIPNRKSVFMRTVVGALALSVLGIIPFIGWVFAFAAMTTGVGMMILGMRRQPATATLAVEAETKKSAKGR